MKSVATAMKVVSMRLVETGFDEVPHSVCVVFLVPFSQRYLDFLRHWLL